MFSQLFTLAKSTTAKPKKAASIEGYLCDTPAASARSSFEDMSNEPAKDDDVSKLHSVSKTGGFHHALLKTARGRHMAVDRDHPIPPSLSRQPSRVEQKQDDHDTVNMAQEEAEPTDLRLAELRRTLGSPAPDRIPDGFPSNPDNTLEKICLDPVSLHTTEGHVQAHHPGLLKGADFCDAGVLGQPLRQHSLSSAASDAVSPSSSELEVALSHIERRMTGGDLCSDTIEVAIPKHTGHSHATKVRPAADFAPFYRHVDLTDGRQAHPAISKVGPFDPLVTDPRAEESSRLIAGSGEDRKPSTQITPTLIGSSHKVADSMGRRGGVPSHIASSSDQRTHESSCSGHQSISKVQPYREIPQTVDARRYSVLQPAEADQEETSTPTVQDSVNSPSQPAPLDYRRTARWLRNLLRYPETYTPSLTEAPSQSKQTSVSQQPDGDNSTPQPEETSDSAPSRKLTRTSTLPPMTVEPGAMSRAVGDLERLLNEALALASMVADQHIPLTQEDHDSQDDDTIGRDQFLRTATEPNGNHMGLSRGPAEPEPPRRLLPHHAYTSPGLERPHLTCAMDSYHTLPLTSSGVDMNEEEPTDMDSYMYLPEDHRRAPAHCSNMTQRAEHRKAPRQPFEAFRCREELSSQGGLSADADVIDFKTQYKDQQDSTEPWVSGHHKQPVSEEPPSRPVHEERKSHQDHNIDLRGRSHVSLRGSNGFSLARSQPRQPIARDWSPLRKKFVAIVACVSTAVIGIILGIFAGIVPSIQYYILDMSHATIYGNVGCFAGMAVPTFLFWPLPLLHGRKPYILSSLAIAMPLLFVQAVSVYSQRFHNIAA